MKVRTAVMAGEAPVPPVPVPGPVPSPDPVPLPVPVPGPVPVPVPVPTPPLPPGNVVYPKRWPRVVVIENTSPTYPVYPTTTLPNYGFQDMSGYCA
jgi:hypothetical protein